MNRWGLAGLAMLFCAGLAQAQAVYRWVDKDGRVHYGDRFPSTVASDVQKRNARAPDADKQLPFATRQAMANFPVTLYTSKDCGDGCKNAADYLKSRGVPFTEKTVASAEEIEALKALVGESAVPTLQVGTKARKGFDAAGWGNTLDAAGYPKATTP